MSLRLLGIGLLCTVSSLFAAVPDWVMNPPADDTVYLYGVGESDSMRTARDEALNTIAAKLSTSVSSKVSTSQTQSTFGSGQLYNGTTSQNLQSEVKKITFQNYDIVYNAVEGSRSYVLVKVEKAKFVAEKKEEIATLERGMSASASKAASRPALERFKLLKVVVTDADKAEILVGVVASLDPKYTKEPHLSVYAKYKMALEDLLYEMDVYVASDSDSRYCADALKEELAAQKIKVAKSANGRKDQVVVDVHSVATVKLLMGRHIAKVRTTLTLKNPDGSAAYQGTLESMGNSSIDAENALISAAKGFAATLKHKGVLTVLGLKE